MFVNKTALIVNGIKYEHNSISFKSSKLKNLVGNKPFSIRAEFYIYNKRKVNV